MEKRYYAGIGSRRTPSEILAFMASLAAVLRMTHTLRSGGAVGADMAFEAGSGDNKEIFYGRDSTEQTEKIASVYHPVWERLSPYAKKLHGRNVFQVLGRDLKTPSELIICWTPDGARSHAERGPRTGGTGTAISLADHNNIPIYNLRNPETLERWRSWVKTLKNI